MSIDSEIEWTEATWNPVVGCSMVSPGCTNCYAMRLAARLEACGLNKYSGVTRRSGGRFVWKGGVHLDERALEIPLHWKKPRLVFVNSMSDLFHEGLDSKVLERIWKVMEEARHHTFQVLTKRPQRMARCFEAGRLWPLPNVWLGTSVESGDYLFRLADLRRVPASVRFVSFEPLLGSVGIVDLSGVHWVIVGGESGPAARPMKRVWVEEIKRACAAQGVAFFFKQWGGHLRSRAGRMLDGRTWDEMPSRAASC